MFTYLKKNFANIIAIIGIILFAYTMYFNIMRPNPITPVPDLQVIKVGQMIDNVRKGTPIPQEVKDQLSIAVVTHGDFYRIPHKKLIAIAWTESRFNPNAQSKTGDKGIMQPNTKWCRAFYEKESDLENVYKNVETACKKIAYDRSMGYDDVAAYHSYTPGLMAEYRKRLNKVLKEIENV